MDAYIRCFLLLSCMTVWLDFHLRSRYDFNSPISPPKLWSSDLSMVDTASVTPLASVLSPLFGHDFLLGRGDFPDPISSRAHFFCRLCCRRRVGVLAQGTISPYNHDQVLLNFERTRRTWRSHYAYDTFRSAPLVLRFACLCDTVSKLRVTACITEDQWIRKARVMSDTHPNILGIAPHLSRLPLLDVTLLHDRAASYGCLYVSSRLVTSCSGRIAAAGALGKMTRRGKTISATP
jgi:hypothetical protein